MVMNNNNSSSTQMALNTYYNAISQVQQIAGPYLEAQNQSTASVGSDSFEGNSGLLPFQQSTDPYFQQPWWNPDNYSPYPSVSSQEGDHSVTDQGSVDGGQAIVAEPNLGTGGGDPSVEALLSRIEMLETELASSGVSNEEQAIQYLEAHFDEIDGGNGFLDSKELKKEADKLAESGDYQTANELRKLADRQKDVGNLKNDVGFFSVFDADEEKDQISKGDLTALANELNDGKTLDEVADKERKQRTGGNFNPVNWFR